MKQDIIEFEILEDGTISIKTDAISPANHVSADELLEQVFELAGGEVKKTERSRLTMTVHSHLYEYHHHHH